MRWQGNRQSENVEDRRGARRPLMMGGGIGGVILLLLVLVLGGPKAVMQLLQQQGGPVAGPQVDEDPQATAFVRTVLADTEDVWDEQFQAVGRAYQKPKLVLFSDEVDSACGFASAAVGPFYCPADRKVYLDTSFFRELEQRFEAPGEFAQAYVIAHEIGHHVQNQLGWSDRVQNAQQRVGKVEANKLSVRLELQADYLAGVWAHHAQRSRNILERGDIQAALDAATAIGDDKLQMESRGRVVPDSFTHGTSAQRARWFKRGLQTGDLAGAELLFQVDDSEL